uniref:transposase n=1 Tax=Candidatus Enterovibrio escicola TaxID=1927127 RepID=UPI0021DF77BE|nr:transposase [Candidatus Enterovibrio escacola]
MADELWGCLHRDKGYLFSPLEQELVDKGVTLIMGVKKNMKPKVMKLWDRLIFWKRFII